MHLTPTRAGAPESGSADRARGRILGPSPYDPRMTDEEHDITALLDRWREGSDAAGDTLMERIHRELRRIAASYLRRERPDPQLQATAVVHEAYIRMVPQRKVHWENRAHFFGIAAQMMRRVLVDHARR